MSRIKSADSKPEILVRKILHALGYRFRLHYKSLPGKPDIVLPGRKKVIFVHGCFWHSHSRCRRATLPSTNVPFWQKKIEGNKARDAAVKRRLSREGWGVLVVWQCQTGELDALTSRLKAFLQ